MSTVFGLNSNSIVPSPNFRASKSQEGGWTGSHQFTIRKEAWDNPSIRALFSTGTKIRDLDPTISQFFKFLTISSIEVQAEEGGFVMISANLAGGTKLFTAEEIAEIEKEATEGSTGENPDPTQPKQNPQATGSDQNSTPEPTYRLSGNLQDAPLSQHPKWAQMTQASKDNLGLLINGSIQLLNGSYFIFDEELNGEDIQDPSGTELEFAQLISGGQTTYLRPVITWSESRQGQKATISGFSRLGKASTPRGGAPEVPDSKWMLTGGFYEERGELATTEYEWSLIANSEFSNFLYE